MARFALASIPLKRIAEKIPRSRTSELLHIQLATALASGLTRAAARQSCDASGPPASGWHLMHALPGVRHFAAR